MQAAKRSEWAFVATPEDFIFVLRQLKGIAVTYRMTNKPLPVCHSPYVSDVLQKASFEGERALYLIEKGSHLNCPVLVYLSVQWTFKRASSCHSKYCSVYPCRGLSC